MAITPQEIRELAEIEELLQQFRQLQARRPQSAPFVFSEHGAHLRITAQPVVDAAGFALEIIPHLKKAFDLYREEIVGAFLASLHVRRLELRGQLRFENDDIDSAGADITGLPPLPDARER